MVLPFEVPFVCYWWSHLYCWRWICIPGHIFNLKRLMHHMWYVGTHEIWFLYLVVITSSWIFTSCVDFNTVPFGTWTWRGKIVFFKFFYCVFGITKYLVSPVPTIALCEDGGAQIGCCKISLVFILGFVLTNISATPCNYIPKVLTFWALSSVSVLLWLMTG